MSIPLILLRASPIINPVPAPHSPSLPHHLSLSFVSAGHRGTQRSSLAGFFLFLRLGFEDGNGAGEAHPFFRRTRELRGNFQSPPTVSRLFEGEVASEEILNPDPHNSSAKEYLGHYAAWGEDLVLAFRSGEIISNYELRDMEQALGRELVISGYGRKDHGAGIGPGVIFIQ
ncbi:uncharacterized protein LOC126609925 [Malus sylvestris]|uniref:uncharacterized protein LOC126609925 n=1 Tax=Malus sylvestris TaxID=3752 RepID=UPI0021ABA13A|nr:uncharacterized protein LOC126609925 [Malus sylvestris]